MLRSRYCFCILCAVGLVLALLLFLAPSTARAQGKGPVSFINDVAPILKENCFACHDAKKRKGKPAPAAQANAAGKSASANDGATASPSQQAKAARPDAAKSQPKAAQAKSVQ